MHVCVLLKYIYNIKIIKLPLQISHRSTSFQVGPSPDCNSMTVSCFKSKLFVIIRHAPVPQDKLRPWCWFRLIHTKEKFQNTHEGEMTEFLLNPRTVEICFVARFYDSPIPQISIAVSLVHPLRILV